MDISLKKMLILFLVYLLASVFPMVALASKNSKRRSVYIFVGALLMLLTTSAVVLISYTFIRIDSVSLLVISKEEIMRYKLYSLFIAQLFVLFIGNSGAKVFIDGLTGNMLATTPDSQITKLAWWQVALMVFSSIITIALLSSLIIKDIVFQWLTSP